MFPKVSRKEIAGMISHGVKPQIRLVFSLTKRDMEDFDRDSVTELIHITPTESLPPALSRCRITHIPNPEIASKELIGISILPSSAPPYQMLNHACWRVRFSKVERWELVDALYEFEQTFKGKETEVLALCKENNLRADLLVRVFAESGNMPDLTIPETSIAFLALMGVSVIFDFYLD